MTRASRTFALASADVVVGADFLPAIRKVPNHHGGEGAPDFTIRAWGRGGIVAIEWSRDGARRSIVRVRLTSKGARMRDAFNARAVDVCRAKEMRIGRRIARELASA